MISKEMIGIVLIFFSVIILSGYFLKMKIDNFFDIKKVVTEYLKIFSENKIQYIILFFIPFLFAVGLALLYTADNNFYSELAVVISIILSMLMVNLSILVGQKFEILSDTQSTIIVVLKETIDAILFASLLCIVLLFCNLIAIIIGGLYFCVDIFLAFFAYYIFTVLLLTVLMIFKRMARIIEYSLKNVSSKK